MKLRGMWGLCIVPALAGMVALSGGMTGCGGGPASVGPGVIFNNVIAADIGGELKVAFPDYSRAPSLEQPRKDDETFMIEIHPAWSPDGEKLAFTRTVGEGRSALFVRASLGHPEAEAKEIGPGEGTPVWSPTSDMVAYLAMTGPPQAEGEAPAEGEKAAEGETSAEGEKKAAEEAKPVGLTVAGDDGSNSRLLVRGMAEPVSWSDEGIYYTAGIYGMRSLHVINANGKGDRLIYAPSGGSRFVGEAALSPDGDLAAMEVVSPDESSVLVIKDLRRRRVLQVTRFGSVSGLAWSPNSKELVFVLAGAVGGPGRVMRWSVGSGRPSVLTSRAGKYRSPRWSSDGKSVAFVMSGNIYMQRIGSNRADPVTKSGDAADIASSPK